MAFTQLVPGVKPQSQLATAKPIGNSINNPRTPCAAPWLLRRCAVVRRFKENDDLEADIQKRKEREQVIRKQEELIQQAAENAGKAAGSAKDELKRDVTRAVETVERSSAGKGYSAAAVKVPLWMPAFTRRREIFVGRIAMVGFFATCVLEILTANHLGPIRQVQMWTGMDTATITAMLMGIVIYNALGGLGPWSPTFSPENLRDVARRPTGPPSVLVNPLNLGKLLGISGWGFTKRNELFHGRLAMLGFAAAVVGELKTGRGALSQLAGYLGIIPDDTYYSAVMNGFIVFAALMLGMSILFPSRLQGAAPSEDDIF
ncbi:hypothetical protein VOLCADRAFT_94261 [Volvox carteri f. nagariensis]|uniref:Uncharacterized protein n=1 Tax=Volvox carteri f. nagariensis TaxID=3068 RepID=D8U417_VOLCA|nr:uncharacterized protein VOLCADRAFT_94261 [Volvox carteri f. nagariensis]EFJ45419.1 hypothetical protein VOLCADRAFT_94261 [Volvox carteri f. nagariensis]|eukprot:XP_002953446.1 hypothetical protein VOLCADRAFT_94261 [Volvox carteri f. nagariensis]